MNQASYRYCRAVTGAAGSSFPLAFRLLSPPRRAAMDALYAFMRLTDDLSDEPGEAAAKRAALAAWRDALAAALAGRPSHPVHPALCDVVARFDVPPRHLFEVVDGVATDVEPVRFETFDALYPYCYHVASAVGLASIRVWGFRPGVGAAEAAAPAEAAGVAFQLTNILRDLGEDLARGRVYLPLDECARFGAPPEAWRSAVGGKAFQNLMAFQVERARAFYRQAEALPPLLSDEGRAIYGVMAGTYEALLDRIEARGYDVFTARVRVPRWRKVGMLLAAWPVKWGWA